jgi:hypothetical protein
MYRIEKYLAELKNYLMLYVHNKNDQHQTYRKNVTFGGILKITSLISQGPLLRSEKNLQSDGQS